MDLSELRRVQRTERSTDSLQDLRESFYADVAEYIESLREERRAAAAEAPDPFRSSRVSELSSEIETAEHIAEAIYQRRIGKLVDEATLSATGSGGDRDGLTSEEQDLYDDLVSRIEDNMATVLDRFAGERPASGDDKTDPSDSDSRPDPGTADATSDPGESGPERRAVDGSPETAPRPDPDSGPSPADAMGSELGADRDETDADADEAVEDGADVDRTTVRMTADVGEIFGVDAKSYDLERDDIVDLPTENAEPLLDRDAAERVE